MISTLKDKSIGVFCCKIEWMEVGQNSVESSKMQFSPINLKINCIFSYLFNDLEGKEPIKNVHWDILKIFKPLNNFEIV